MRILVVVGLAAFLVVFFLSARSFASSMICNKNKSANNCLVCNCYHESRGETYEGMVAVAKVVLSRVAHPSFPNSVCRVVYQSSQFSWTEDGIPNNIRISKGKDGKDDSADKKALDLCQSAVDTAVKEGENGVVYYYNPALASPAWAKKMIPCGTIDNHRFLVPQDSSCPAKLGVTGVVKPASTVQQKKTTKKPGKKPGKTSSSKKRTPGKGKQ